MKLVKLIFPEGVVQNFVFFCESMDIKICLSYSIEEMFDTNVVAFINLSANCTEIPEALKEEKLKEKYLPYIKK